MKHNKVYVRIAEDDNFGTVSIEPRPFTEVYIHKDMLLEWVKKENLKFNQIGNGQDDDFARGIAAGFGYLISKLGSL